MRSTYPPASYAWVRTACTSSRTSGSSPARGMLTRGRRSGSRGGVAPLALHAHVGDDRALRPFEVDPLLDDGEVAGAHLRLQVVADVHDQGRMHPRPEQGVLQVRVHAGKDHAHGAILRDD